MANGKMHIAGKKSNDSSSREQHSGNSKKRVSREKNPLQRVDQETGRALSCVRWEDWVSRINGICGKETALNRGQG